MTGDLGLFAGDRGLAYDLATYERRRLEQVWRDGRSRHGGRCRSCHAPLRWLVTENGKWMPVDAEPDPAGNVEIEQRGCAQVALVAGPSDDVAKQAGLTVRYMPHHATCPHADGWRSRWDR